MADLRHCEQCGTVFVPRREHARFCSGRCRVAWNREKDAGNRDKPGDLVTEASALQWSVTAMNDMARRLPRISASDQPGALAVIGEMVWQVTIIDATLVRYHPDVYDRVMARQPASERQRIEGTLGGLRFVRNRMRDEAGQPDIVGRPGDQPEPAGGPVTAWAWTPVPEPALAFLPPRGRSWEMTRYHAYQEYLAGHAVGESFERATAFLSRAAACVTPDVSAPAVR
ncbi:MAG: hypothetical protein ACRDNZ_10670 [Streptosporangiaceae bacterium]